MHSNKIAAAPSRKQEGRFPASEHVGTAALAVQPGKARQNSDTISPSIPLVAKDAQMGASSMARLNQYCPYLPRTESSSFWES